MELQNHRIAIIGLGYVGLPLAMAFALKKFEVLGFDKNPERIEALIKGIDKTGEVSREDLKAVSGLRFSNKQSELKNAEVYIVTVPTPLTASKKPDLSYLLAASKLVGQHLSKGNIVIYESTVYPGCTEEDCVPVLEKASGLEYNSDFFCGYSPERINPGDQNHKIQNVVKVTSGSNQKTAEFVDRLYKCIIEVGTHKVSSIRVAEAAKIIENTQRDLNIALVNELALIFDKMNLDTLEVLEAAGTKWNFMPFRPGLVGGHCIGVDPYYLTFKAEKLGYRPEVILAGRKINDAMPVKVAHKVIKLMVGADIRIKKAAVLILGITFKANCPDIRNSKVIALITELKGFGVSVSVHDPWADPKEVFKTHGFRTLAVSHLKKYDAIVNALAHKQFLDLDIENLKSTPNTIVYDVKSFLPRDWVTGRL